VYDRAALMALASSPLARTPPTNLPYIPGVTVGVAPDTTPSPAGQVRADPARWFVCSRCLRTNAAAAAVQKQKSPGQSPRPAGGGTLALLYSLRVLCVLTCSLLRRRRAVRHGRLSQAQHLARASRRGPTLSRTAYLVAPTHTVIHPSIHHPCPCTVTLHRRLPVVVRVHPPLAATSRLLTAMRRPFVQQCPS